MKQHIAEARRYIVKWCEPASDVDANIYIIDHGHTWGSTQRMATRFTYEEAERVKYLSVPSFRRIIRLVPKAGMITVSGMHPENIHKPQRKGDVGYDLSISERVHLWPDQLIYVPTGVSLGFPKGVWGEIVGRSSTMGKHRLLVMHSIIDTGFTGELKVGLWNTGMRPVELEVGTRIAQLILRETVYRRLQIGLLPETDRGEQAFGSTGVS